MRRADVRASAREAAIDIVSATPAEQIVLVSRMPQFRLLIRAAGILPDTDEEAALWEEHGCLNEMYDTRTETITMSEGR